jgi:NADPH:quinone reductase-like Zn-dependent oxidoreductase
MSALTDLVVAGQLVPTIAATFPFDQAAAAQSANAGPGKVVLTFTPR